MKPNKSPLPYVIRTHREVAKALGLTRRQVQIAESKAIKKIRVALGAGALESLR